MHIHYTSNCKSSYPAVCNVQKNDDDVFIHLHFFASIQMALNHPHFYMVRGLTKISACELLCKLYDTWKKINAKTSSEMLKCFWGLEFYFVLQLKCVTKKFFSLKVTFNRKAQLSLFIDFALCFEFFYKVCTLAVHALLL